MSVEENNGRSKFTVTAEEEVKVASYSVTADEGDGNGARAAAEENAHNAVEVSSEIKPDTVKKSSVKGEGIVSIPANNSPKNYTKEFIYIALLVVLCAAGALLAYYIETYKYAGIILAALSLLAAAALVRHIFDCRKVRTLVSSGQCKTVTELMKAMKKTKRPEFLRTLGGIVRDGHLTDYAIVDDEYFAYRPAKNSDR